jgi:acetyl esterase/lipase
MTFVNKISLMVPMGLLILACGLATGPATGQTVPTAEPLWPTGKVPMNQGNGAIDTPEITPHIVSSQLAVVVFPGGGYRNLALDHEGDQIAKWLNQRGISAFVVKYRLGPKYHHPVMLTDAQRAVRIARSRASQHGYRPDRIGVWGFSAGGHLAATVSTHFLQDTAPADDPTKSISSRPDFAILSYPVITGKDGVKHGGSFQNLLGDNPDPKLVESLSNETQVTQNTPPTFIFHTTDDKAVPVMNAILYYQALVAKGVAAEMHIYQNGRHGVGLAKDNPILATWADRLHDWLVPLGVRAR